MSELINVYKNWEDAFGDKETTEKKGDPFFFLGEPEEKFKIEIKCDFCNKIRRNKNGAIELCGCKESEQFQLEQLEKRKLHSSKIREAKKSNKGFLEARKRNKRSFYRKKQ
ncbi:MAG: hypothetical protein ACW98X_26650 [Promethearchaeota archaeon]|jgi:hypothetical protein